MQTGAEASRAQPPALMCVPSSDDAFRELAANVLESLARVTPAALEDALTARYPQARVRRRELDGEPVETWYVYRDRSFPAADDEAAHHH